jgi:hypothetical protein
MTISPAAVRFDEYTLWVDLAPVALAPYHSIAPPALDVIPPIVPLRLCYLIGPLHPAANSLIFVSSIRSAKASGLPRR